MTSKIILEKEHKFFGNYYAKEQILAEYSKKQKQVKYWHLAEVFGSDCSCSDSYTESRITKEQAKMYLEQDKKEKRENAIKQELLKSVSISDLELKIEIK